jgi:ubiquinone/menaquinone biosynthesis C-methylase UbiE
MSFTNPDANIGQLKLEDGMSVAVFGSGAGGHSFAASRALKGTGAVFAIDVRPEMLDKVKADASNNGAFGVRPVLGNCERLGGTTLREEQVNAVVIPNTLFAYDDKQGVFAEAFRITKPGGKCMVVDWSSSFNNMGPPPDQIVTQDAAKSLAETAGFVFEESFPAGSQHYGLLFEKPQPLQ